MRSTMLPLFDYNSLFYQCSRRDSECDGRRVAGPQLHFYEIPLVSLVIPSFATHLSRIKFLCLLGQYFFCALRRATDALCRARRARPSARHVKPRTWRVQPRTWRVQPRTWRVQPRTWRVQPRTWRVRPRARHPKPTPTTDNAQESEEFSSAFNHVLFFFLLCCLVKPFLSCLFSIFFLFLLAFEVK